MKVLMLVNWKIEYTNLPPTDKQPPDYYVTGIPYWFYRYFKETPQVDVVDISSFGLLEKFEKNVLRFYIWQTVKILRKIKNYDLIVSHGIQSGIVLGLWRRLFKTKCKHIVFEIGSFNSAAEGGFAQKLMQYASKSIDGFIYHTSSQLDYYKKYYPWICERSRFIRFGTDLEFFESRDYEQEKPDGKYILCVGYNKRDWQTLVNAYKKLDTDLKLRLVGHIDDSFNGICGIEQIPFIPVSELKTEIKNADFCVLPLEYFNYSYGQMTLMQQMAMGKCVITAKVPSIVDYVSDGNTAVLYQPGNEDDLKEKMGKVITDTGYRENVAYAARQSLEDHCNEKIMAKDIEAFFADVLGEEE